MASTSMANTSNVNFDTDLYKIGIDNRVSACISHKVEDFDGPLHETNKVIKGIAGTRVTRVKKGTIKWRIEDDRGKTTTFRIPESYYIPTGGVRLLSPQHWAQQCRYGRMEEATNKKEVILRWKGRTKMIPLGTGTNVATLRSTPGYSRFNAFCATAEIDPEKEDSNPITMPTLVSDDDKSTSSGGGSTTGETAGEYEEEAHQTLKHQTNEWEMGQYIPTTWPNRQGGKAGQQCCSGVPEGPPTNGTPLTQKNTEDGQDGHTTQTTGQLPGSCVYGMHICQGNQTTMVHKDIQKHKAS